MTLDELEKKMNRLFAQPKSQIEEDDKSSDNEQSHFQFLNMAHDNVVLKQSKGKLKEIDLHQVILLDNCLAFPPTSNYKWILQSNQIGGYKDCR